MRPSHRLLLSLMVGFLWISLAMPLRAQLPPLDPCAAGLSYIIAFPDTTQKAIDARFPSGLDDRFYLFLYSTTDSNKVTITVKGGTSQTITLLAGKFKELSLIPKR